MATFHQIFSHPPSLRFVTFICSVLLAHGTLHICLFIMCSFCVCHCCLAIKSNKSVHINDCLMAWKYMRKFNEFHDMRLHFNIARPQAANTTVVYFFQTTEKTPRTYTDMHSTHHCNKLSYSVSVLLLFQMTGDVKIFKKKQQLWQKSVVHTFVKCIHFDSY